MSPLATQRDSNQGVSTERIDPVKEVHGEWLIVTRKKQNPKAPIRNPPVTSMFAGLMNSIEKSNSEPAKNPSKVGESRKGKGILKKRRQEAASTSSQGMSKLKHDPKGKGKVTNPSNPKNPGSNPVLTKAPRFNGVAFNQTATAAVGKPPHDPGPGSAADSGLDTTLQGELGGLTSPRTRLSMLLRVIYK